MNQSKGCETKIIGDKELSGRQLQPETNPKTLAGTMAAYLMYTLYSVFIVHVTACRLSGMGIVLFQPGCMTDATFDCTKTLNVISKTAPGLNMIQHQNAEHLIALV